MYCAVSTCWNLSPCPLHTSTDLWVRREVNILPSDPRYTPIDGYVTMANRKESPPSEMPGDIFDRQRVIVDFDQPLVERQICLVLGTGGIGQNVALALARLGVKEIILVDYDDYDLTNLTRQCLGSLPDVGGRKVDVAAKNLKHHNLRSIVTPMHLDVLLQWPQVVKLAQRASVIFNCCDIGPLWDHAINALSKELQLPLCVGQSYAWQWMSEFYSGRPENFCASCGTDFRSQFSADRDTKRIGAIAGRLEAAAVKLTGDAALGLSEEQLLHFLVDEPMFRLLPTHTTKQMISRALVNHGEKRASTDKNSSTEVLCVTAANLKAFNLCYHDICLSMVLPGRVSQLSDLGFLPRPEHPPTRFIGSWVVPCMACSISMVGQWVNTLTGPASDLHAREVPTMITFKLNEGMTADEAVGYGKRAMFEETFAEENLDMSAKEVLDTTRLCFLMDDAERKFSTSPSDKKCETCAMARARAVKMDEDLFFGTVPVYFERVGGRVDVLQSSRLEVMKSPRSGSPDQPEPSQEVLLQRDHHFHYDVDDDSCHLAEIQAAPAAAAEEGKVSQQDEDEDVSERNPHGGRTICGWHVPTHGTVQYEVSKLQAIRRTTSSYFPQYPNVLIPAMPCVEVLPDYTSPRNNNGVIFGETKNDSLSPRNVNNKPPPPSRPMLPLPLLRAPLLKVPCSGRVVLEGVASGLRSALVQVSSGEHHSWYRLKGCGNQERGFPVEVKGGHGEVNPRGSCFAHTAHNELYMTSVGNELLAPLGVKCANTSLGAYAYNSAALGEELCPFPAITRWCAVFSTEGDKRLGDHLLAGLEMLLPYLVVPSPATIKQVTQALALGRGVSPDDELLPTDMCVACEMPLADLTTQVLEERSPPSALELGASLVAPRWAVLWDSTSRRLASTLQPLKESQGVPSLLLYLLWRLGWECGAVQRAFIQGGMSWGTYPDKMGIHCNAHANNMAVKQPPVALLTRHAGGVGAANNNNVETSHQLHNDDDPRNKGLLFLAPLDFDMAFTRETYLPQVSGESLSFEQALILEKNGFANSLSGSTFISTGVKNTRAELSPAFSSISLAMRDTLVKAFFTACSGAADPHPVNESLMQPCQDLIRLALCLTSHVVA